MKRRQLLQTAAGSVIVGSLGVFAITSLDNDNESDESPGTGPSEGTERTAAETAPQEPETETATETATDTDTSTETETQTETPTDEAGKTIESESGFRFTLEEYVLSNFYRADGERSSPPEGNQYLLARMTVRNNGTEEATPPARSDFFAVDGSDIRYNAVEIETGYNSEGTVTHPISAPIYAPPEGYSGVEPIPAGDTLSGLLVFEIPSDIEDPMLTLPNQRQPTPTPDDEEGDGPDPEPIDWRLSTEDTHRVAFETEITAPDPPFIQHETYTYSVTVTNTGGRAGRYYGAFGFSGADTGEDDLTLQQTVGGGESVTKEVSARITTDETFTAFFNDTVLSEAQITPPTFAFGEPWTTPDGLEVTVRNVQFVDEITVSEDGETSTQQPSDGNKFLAFEIVSQYTGNDDSSAFPTDFTVQHSDWTVENTASQLDFVELAGSTIDRWYDPSGLYVYGPGDSENGWLVYSVPASTTLDSIALTTYRETGFAGNYDYGQWTASGDRPDTSSE